jgi:hypothetical protein
VASKIRNKKNKVPIRIIAAEFAVSTDLWYGGSPLPTAEAANGVKIIKTAYLAVRSKLISRMKIPVIVIFSFR